jgi:ribosomal protein L7/L12
LQTVLGLTDFLIVAAIAFVAGRLGADFGARRGGELDARNARKLDLILQHLGIAADPVSRPGELSAEVRALADAGDKVAAIKRYREETGADLRESNAAIEDYRARVRH